ncbi:hypothetical protein BZG36_03554 [Bifiguratus adelaidae]|uniref:Uncharacterized protein n=1 Tax=Bifiguratus adelaidae TaxID=1938954 RepID=A0A261Y0B7_9FUNG|nr:hypothetical protein BZG36_03554 [Bifiguratus adelaidae]
MSWSQTTIRLPPKSQGCHLIDHEIERQVPDLRKYKIGMANIFLQHTSASLMLNENADPGTYSRIYYEHGVFSSGIDIDNTLVFTDVRKDMNMALDKIAPENLPYIHTDEGPDDMPGHVKSGIVGVSLNIPITNGRLNTGTWQGIYLCEHRRHNSGRKIVVTLQGQT